MDYFKGISLFSDLTKEEREKISCFCQIRDLSEWEVLFNEWDDGTAMYILVDWAVEVYKNSIEWRVVLWEIHSEDVLWEMALIWESHKRMASAVAIKNSRLITVLSFSIDEIFLKYPDLLEKIKSIILERERINEITLN